ncbi:MAG TPA: LytR C-terminal domain-containing protein [Jiangellaceae bacterium]
MTERSRFDRAWPSLLALVGTVAVVLALLWAFGSDIDPDRTDDEPVAEDGELPDAAADEEAEAAGEETEATESEAPDEEAEPPADPVTAPPELLTPVGILNGTSITGLAGRAQQRFEDGGWLVPAIDTTSREIEATTVFYPPGLEESAEALQAQFPEIVQIAPTEPGLAQDRLVVVLAQDYAEAMGET